jgi:hypothetical protein
MAGVQLVSQSAVLIQQSLHFYLSREHCTLRFKEATVHFRHDASILALSRAASSPLPMSWIARMMPMRRKFPRCADLPVALGCYGADDRTAIFCHVSRHRQEARDLPWAVVVFSWSFQHVVMPLTFDPDFMLYRLLSSIAFSTFITLVSCAYAASCRWRRRIGLWMEWQHSSALAAAAVEGFKPG